MDEARAQGRPLFEKKKILEEELEKAKAKAEKYSQGWKVLQVRRGDRLDVGLCGDWQPMPARLHRGVT
jgi:hypothetical protein